MLNHFPCFGMNFLLHIFNLSWSLHSLPPSGRPLPLFPSIGQKSLSTFLLSSGLSLSSPLSQSFLKVSFYHVCSSFWSLISFSFPTRLVSVLNSLLAIKFFMFLSPFLMGLTNPNQTLGRFLLLSTSAKLSTLSCILTFSTSLFWLALFLPLLVGLNLSSLIGMLVWFIKITKVAPFESVKVFCKNPFLALEFFLFSSMIFLLFCLLPSAALFMLTIGPFGPPTPRPLLHWRPLKELCFNLSTVLVLASSS